jgi:hypothetical protein
MLTVISDLYHVITQFSCPISEVKQYFFILFSKGIKAAHEDLFCEIMTFYLNSISYEEGIAFFDLDKETQKKLIYEYSGFKG